MAILLLGSLVISNSQHVDLKPESLWHGVTSHRRYFIVLLILLDLPWPRAAVEDHQLVIKSLINYKKAFGRFATVRWELLLHHAAVEWLRWFSEALF